MVNELSWVDSIPLVMRLRTSGGGIKLFISLDVEISFEERHGGTFHHFFGGPSFETDSIFKLFFYKFSQSCALSLNRNILKFKLNNKV